MRDKKAVLLPANPWPLVASVAVLVVGFLVVIAGHWRPGSLIMAVAMLAAGGMRLVLPRHISGLLVLRRRLVDVVIMLGLGISILVFALLVPPGS
jgi:hypothetical protein